MSEKHEQLLARLPQPETKPIVLTLDDADPTARRARILTRVSDDKLRSIPQQVTDCAEYLRDMGDAAPSLDGLYNVGEHSGFSMSESHVYRQLLDDAREGRFHALVIRDSSRLGRDYWEKFGTLRDLRAAKVELHVVEDGGSFDYEDRLSKVKSWASTWADEEKKREEIRKAVRATDALREMGLPTVTPPYGYKTIKDPKIGRRVWRESNDAPTVRALFAQAATEPATPLAELGRRHGLERDRVWRILRNRAYTGGFTWKGAFHECAPEVVPPLVDAATFERVQERLSQPRAK